MAHPDETRRAVRAAFVFDHLSLGAAAAKLGVKESNVRRWKAEARKAGDDWDKARSAQLIAGGGIEEVTRQTLAIVVQQVQATVEAMQADESMSPAAKVQLLASLADAYNKLMAVSKRMMPETDKLAVAMDVLRRFSEFVATKKPALAGEFVELIEPFGDEIVKSFS